MVDANQSAPLATPVASKRKISAIGKGKASFITWKNGLLALAWLILSAFIGFLCLPSACQMWIKGVTFGAIAVPGLCFFLIPIPGKDYYWIYNYVFSSIKFFFAKSANRMPNLGATSEFIPFSYIKDNKLFLKGESSVQIFWRLNGRNIYSCSKEIQDGLLNNYHDLVKNLHNSTVKVVSFKCNFNLKSNYEYWKSIIKEESRENIQTSFLPLAVLEWQNWQFKANFPFYKDNREELRMMPQPRDVVYMLVISGESEAEVVELSKIIVPSMMALDNSFVEPASSEDIKMYIAKQFGMTSVDLINGFDSKKEEGTQAQVEEFNELFSNMHSLVFKSKYWKSRDWRRIGTLSQDHYHRMLTISNFKSDAILGWMDPLFEDPAIDCIQVKYQDIPIDKQTKLIGKAINQYTKVETKSGNLGSFASAKLEDTFQFLKAIESETNRANVTLVKTTVYIKISAPSIEKLNRKEIELKAALKKQLGLDKKSYDAFWFKQRDAFLASFGVLNDKFSKKTGINLLSSAIALGWPFNNPRIIQPKGFHIGFTQNALCPICLDLVGQRSLSGMIIGKTGSGKSILAKLLSLNLLLNPRNKLFWFDPENEMGQFGRNLNAVHIDLTSQESVISKIEFEELKKEFLKENLLWNEKQFLFAYMALLKLPKSYKFMYGLPNKKIKELFKQNKYNEYKEKIKEFHLINETMDFFGLGSLQNHSKLVSINNAQITPQMVKAQVMFFDELLKKNTGIQNTDEIWRVYSFIYNMCVKNSNINPYRIVLSSNDDLKSLNPFSLYQSHKQMLLTWFKQLVPKADVIGTTWFSTTLDKLYQKELGIFSEEEDGQQVIHKTTKELINAEKYPTIQDHYNIMKDEFYDLCAYKNSMEKKHPRVQTKDLEERIRIYNEVLSVFDNLVTVNRFDEKGIFYYLWNKDNVLKFSESKKLIIFNIQNLLSNVRNIKENNYTDQLKIDFQNIFNAQYYLSQQIIWSFVVNNRIENNKHNVPKDQQSHVFIFMDEAHASLKQPQFVDWSVNLIKRARKYQAGLWLITQSLGDYLKLDDAPELFNSFMFKFYFQSEAQAFDDIIKKFQISRVPLTVSEERWLNPLLGETTQGRCILTFEDGKRYMMTVTTSINFIISMLEKDLIELAPYKVYNYQTKVEDIVGYGISGWLGYIRSDNKNYKAAKMDKILEKSYNTWLDNNLRKYNYNAWYKKEQERLLRNAEAKAQKKQKGKEDWKKSADLSKKEKRSNK